MNLVGSIGTPSYVKCKGVGFLAAVRSHRVIRHSRCWNGAWCANVWIGLLEMVSAPGNRQGKGEDDARPEPGLAYRLQGIVARLPRPVRRVIGWLVYLTFVALMFALAALPMWFG